MRQKKESPWGLTLYQWGDEPIPKEWVSYLQSLRALDSSKKFTDIGEEMIKLPCEARWARMIVEANRIGVMSDTLRAIAIMKTGSLIYNNAKDALTGRPLTYRDVSPRYAAISDILSEVDFFNDIVNRRYPDLYKAGVYVKNLQAVKREISSFRKIVKDVYGRISDDAPESTKVSNMLRVIAVGLPDCIYELEVDRGNMTAILQDADRPYQVTTFPIAKKSEMLVCSYDNIVFGIPYTIKTGVQILTFGSRISKFDATRILSDMLVRDFDDDSVRYQPSTDTFTARVRTYLNSILLDDTFVEIREGDKDWESINRTYDWMRSATVRVGNTDYPIYPQNDQITIWPVVYITNLEDVKASTRDGAMIRDHLVTWMISINGEIHKSISLNNLREEIETAERGYVVNTAIGSKFASMGLDIKDLPTE